MTARSATTTEDKRAQLLRLVGSAKTPAGLVAGLKAHGVGRVEASAIAQEIAAEADRMLDLADAIVEAQWE